MNKAEVLERYNTLTKTNPGLKRYPISRDFRRVLMTNPQIISDIVFDDTIDAEIKEAILFSLSKDHSGSCRITDNPRWADMMRSYIIPRFDVLPEDFRYMIKWYQDMHGL